MHKQAVTRENNPPPSSEFRTFPQPRAIYPRTLIILLCNLQIWKRSWHDPPWRGSRNARILPEITNPLMVAQKVFVQETLASHILGWRFQHGKDRVGKDCWFAQIAFVGSVGFGCCGFNGLDETFSEILMALEEIYAYGCWTNARNRHSVPTFSFPIHR